MLVEFLLSANRIAWKCLLAMCISCSTIIRESETDTTSQSIDERMDSPLAGPQDGIYASFSSTTIWFRQFH